VTPTAFGQQLRRQRERAGVTLDALARRTNVMASLFAALEQGDCSRWPPGVYGRGFLRAYASAIGIDPDGLVADASEHFPQFNEDGTSRPLGLAGALGRRREQLRMSLDDGPPVLSRSWRALLAFGGGLALAGVAGMAGWYAGAGFWAPAALAICLCYAVALAVLARPDKPSLARPQVGLGLSTTDLDADENEVNILPVPDPLTPGAHLSRS
jgi:transcriptional regulator with XRE-family HTH domain